MDWLAIVITLAGGVIGGNGLAAITKNFSIGTTGNTIAGALFMAGAYWLSSRPAVPEPAAQPAPAE